MGEGALSISSTSSSTSEVKVENHTPTTSDHLAPERLAALRSGDCLDDERLRIEEHCLWCAECREKMALVLQSLSQQTGIEREPEFISLVQIGDRIAAQMLKQSGSVSKEVMVAAGSQKGVRSSAETGKPESGGLWQWLTGLKPLTPYAVVAILIIAIACLWSYFRRPDSPIERSLEAMREAWNDSRPLEARVAGNFPYLPYKVTRGQPGAAAFNQKLLLAAKADLAREAATRPTVRARQALGRLLLLESDFDKAQEELEAALNEAPENASLRVDLAALYYERGMLEQSPLLLGRAAEQCQAAIKLAPKLPEAWFNLALCQEQRLLLTESRKAWEKYLEVDSSSKWADEARARLQKLRERSENSSPKQLGPAGLASLADSLSAAGRAGDETRLRSLLTEHFVETTGLAEGRFLDEYLNALEAGDRASAESSHSLLQRIAQFSAAMKGDLYLSDLLNFVARADPASVKKIKEIRGLLRRAEQNHREGNYQNALALYSDAGEAAERIGDVCHREAALCGSASIYIHGIETPDRLTLREKLVSETARRRHRRLQAKALLALANPYVVTQLISKTLEVSLRAYEIADQLGDTDTAVNSLRFVGGAYSSLGNTEAAIGKNFAALQLLLDRGMIQLRACQAYSQIAEAFARSGQPASALAYQLEAFQYCDGKTPASYPATVRGRAALYYSNTGDQEEAVRLMNDAISRAEKYDDEAAREFLLADLHISLGNIYLQQAQYEGAVRAFQTAKGLIAQTDHHRYLSAIHEGLATAYREQRQYEAAEAELRKSLELAERARLNINESRGRSFFLGSRMGVYRTMMDFQYSVKGLFDSAYYYAELSRNRELLDALNENAEFRCKQNQSALQCPGSVSPLTLKQVQRALPPEAQLVEYALTERGLLIWVITSDRSTTTSKPIAPARLRQMVSEYLAELYAHRDTTSLNSRAGELYQLLIEPVAGHLDKRRTLVIIPDGVLCAVPFSALYFSGRYLLEDYTVITCPSASVLVRTLSLGGSKRKESFDSLLTLSNPKFNHQLYRGLRPLLRSEQEAERMRQYYPVSFHLSRQQADKQSLLERIDHYDIVHLATHSLINEQNPLLSSIVLAEPASAETSPEIVSAGSLPAYEIFGLRFNRTRLVILASCRSGLMVQPRSNGLGGLAHAFFSARVPTVIASLWDVDDESAAELMVSFHQLHRVEKKSFSQALRQAQLSLMNSADGKWRHPFYWAAFSLSGDGFTA
jgi:CHAT domain-containing protein/Tfp pilus assembly protein PilF